MAICRLAAFRSLNAQRSARATQEARALLASLLSSVWSLGI